MTTSPSALPPAPQTHSISSDSPSISRDSGAGPSGFGDRLAQRMNSHGAVCVGLDPHPGLLRSWGLEVTAAGAREFSLATIAALHGDVAAFKPQSALFEQFGSAGVVVLADVVAECRRRGVICIMDAKRGDIGSTMAGYGRAYADPLSDLASDALTVSPYLGWGSLEPALELARAFGRGVFALALTSNPEGEALQAALIHSGPMGTGDQEQGDASSAAQSVAASIVAAAHAANTVAHGGGNVNVNPGWRIQGAVGLVVGATVKDRAQRDRIDLSDFNGPYLVPGVGAQGGSANDLRALFGERTRFALVNSSRAVLGQGPDPISMRRAVHRLRDEIQAVW